ncbi:MAG TPA: 1,6-anhydro-N-acetylmuramyl-L-alanine amidase AmpD [Gammaproteobacteria bacterium]|jgi:AmpD protein|nr:1,6-anhydro-N-acetylmuramyl-L-alanine amidase AmpD [Gammaproteobacteria bacterium]
MNLDVQIGLFDTIPYLPSPHCDERPKNILIDTIVLHGISLPPGKFGTGMVENLFSGQLDICSHPYLQTIATLKLSTHLFINRMGMLIQFVPFLKRAWHAGVSEFQGRTQCNDFSIGIELEGTDDMPYEKIQYAQLSRVLKLLMRSYASISRDRIVGHSDVAPGRKTDPGPFFDWNHLDRLLYRLL